MHISVVIVTKNRSKDLIQCIGSLLAQSVPLDELVIVDNNSSDYTKEIVAHFQKNTAINIKYVLEKSQGYPTVYNRGLQESSHQYCAFIDDDCVADSNWYLNCKSFLKENTKASVVIGESKTYFTENVYSLLTLCIDYLWKKKAIVGKTVTDFEVLDNKNIIYNKFFLKKNQLEFDETRIHTCNGSAEDSDLGMQIQEKNGRAFYNKDMVIWHKDPVSFTHYYKKLYYSTIGHITYEEKWSLFRKTSLSKKNYSNRQLISLFLKKGKRKVNAKEKLYLNLIQKILLVAHLLISYGIVKGIKFKNRFIS